MNWVKIYKKRNPPITSIMKWTRTYLQQYSVETTIGREVKNKFKNEISKIKEEWKKKRKVRKNENEWRIYKRAKHFTEVLVRKFISIKRFEIISKEYL